MRAAAVAADSTGSVLIQAGTNFDGGTPANGLATGGILLQDGSQVTSEDGSITLQAPGDIDLSIVNANSNADGDGRDSHCHRRLRWRCLRPRRQLR